MELGNWMTLVQVAITLLVAALLHELTSVMATRFLTYWSRAWLALSFSLIALVISVRLDAVLGESNFVSILMRMASSILESFFCFYLWIGCRNYHSGRECGGKDYLILIVPGLVAILLPFFSSSVVEMKIFQSYIALVFFVLCIYHFRRKVLSAPMHLGLRLLRLSLFGLTILFAHYAFVVGFFRFSNPSIELLHMQFASLYDAGMEIVLAFGMVLLVTEQVRTELLDRNSKLAAATEELERAVCTDPLTGLFNRRAYDRYSSDKTYGFGAVAILDVNDLKPLNDEFGHANGDVALQLISRALRIHFRVTDPLYRLGGDEFAVVMPGCQPEELAFRMAKIDEALSSQRLPGVDHPIDLKISWGVAAFESPAQIKEAVNKADERMYLQKIKRKGEARTKWKSSFVVPNPGKVAEPQS
ncbi:MAG: GGDEF domain-containing protein [Gemmataceae bacterium]